MEVKTICFRDLTEKREVTIKESGTHFIGLATSGQIAVGRDENDLCMTFVRVHIADNGGCVLGGANNDFTCVVNGDEQLSGEINLVNGMKFEIADRTIMYVDGHIPRKRRKLPQTPGTMVGDGLPAKPSRASQKNTSESGSSHDQQPEDKADTDQSDQLWLETSWCMLDLSPSDQSAFSELQTPEQISILAASYFTKQLRLFTDAVITTKLLDDIFKLFMETVEDCKDTYLGYLADVSRALGKCPDRSNSRPMHGPAVRFLCDLVRHVLEPVERVLLLLDLLRTFSHFDSNLATLVRCQATATVLGTMSAYLDVIEVQRFGTDILAKIATHKPSLDKKAPIREVAVDMLVRGVKHHSKDLALARSACRVLANLSSALITALNVWIDEGCEADDTERFPALEKYEGLLVYTFQEGIPLVQTIMKNFYTDLGVNTEGRKFIFFYAKLPHLQMKKTAYEQNLNRTRNSIPRQSSTDDALTSGDDDVTYQVNIHPGQLLTAEAREQEDPQGILKTRGTYEEQRTTEKKILFADDTAGGSESESESSDQSLVSDAGVGEMHIKPDVQFDASAEDFSTHVVQHFVRKTIRRKSQVDVEDEDLSDSEGEFLQSLTVKPLVSPSSSKNGLTVERKGDSPVPADDSTLDTEDIHRSINTDITGPIALADDKTGDEQTDNHIESSAVNVDVVVDVRTSAEANGTSKPDTNDMVADVPFLGKLVRTQIVVYVGTLVFQGDDTKVLMVIDQPIGVLLETAGAPPGLQAFAKNQYGGKMTLMDLEPEIVIGVIDAVRYRSVTKELVQTAVLSLTRAITPHVQSSAIGIVMMFYKALFADACLTEIIKEESFLAEFRTCFQRATERMGREHSVEEIRQLLHVQPQPSNDTGEQ